MEGKEGKEGKEGMEGKVGVRREDEKEGGSDVKQNEG
jgi:hypothetical protein